MGEEPESKVRGGGGWTRGRPSRRLWYIIAGVLGFWLILVLVGQFTDWVSADALFEIFLVSTIVLGLAVPAVALTCRMEDRGSSGRSEGAQRQTRSGDGGGESEEK